MTDEADNCGTPTVALVAGNTYDFEAGSSSVMGEVYSNDSPAPNIVVGIFPQLIFIRSYPPKKKKLIDKEAERIHINEHCTRPWSKFHYHDCLKLPYGQK